MTDLVTIFGGSGFLGRYVARRMAKSGWRVRVACRHPNDAAFVRTYGVVGQVEPVFCNIRDDEGVRSVTRGAHAVVNCVGILAESRKQTFDNLQQKGAGRIAGIAREEGVGRLIHVSAIGANADSSSAYTRTKALGEQAVLDAFPDAMIVRPSIMFGHEDEFFNRFASMARRSPVIPIVGASTKFQPVYVDDVAHAIQLGVLGDAAPSTYELGGTDIRTFRELMLEMLEVIRRRRLVLGVPMSVGRLMGSVFDNVKWMTGGLVAGPLTRDQVENLGQDNVVGQDARTFADLGISPVATEAVLPDYLWRFRPSGQYARIKESARNLRKGQP